MKIKFIVNTILLVSILFLNSCGGLGSKDYIEMPTGAEFEKVYNALMKDRGEGIEFYEISGQFDAQSRNMSIPTSFTVTYMPKDNKTTFYEYSRNMTDGRWTGPTQITLHENQIGKGKGAALSRDKFTDVMFKIEDMPNFSQFDDMYKKAIDAAELGDGSCVIQFNMKKDNNENKFSIIVGMKEKDNKTKKEIFFDKAGNIVK